VCGRGAASALRSGVSPPDADEQRRGPCTPLPVAIYHLSADVVRRSAGRTVTAAAAYRAGALIVDERTGLTFDYRRRQGVVHAEIIAPADVPAWMRDRARLWNAVEAGERRKDAQLARDIELALPHELTPLQRLDLARGFIAAAFVGEGMVADLAIHAPSRHGADRRNHHAHVLLTLRAIAGDGFGNKERTWNDPAKLEAWRALWAEHVNRALEHAGEAARVDHRSLAAQGIEREPQVHLGPAVAEMEARGIGTDRAELAQEIKAINTALAGIEAQASPPAPAITLALGRDLVRRRRNTGGAMLAAFRAAARMVWGRIQTAARPGPRGSAAPAMPNPAKPGSAMPSLT